MKSRQGEVDCQGEVISQAHIKLTTIRPYIDRFLILPRLFNLGGRMSNHIVEPALHLASVLA
jgi:hypothetical protein